MSLRWVASCGLCIVTACGDDASLIHDGGVDRDGTVDIGGDAAPSTRVTVTLDGAPASGVSVVVHDAQGLPTATLMTDVDGRVQPDVVDGALVTIVTPAADAVRLVTIADVHAGDDLMVPLRTNDKTTTLTAALTLSSQAGASLYSVSTGCNTTFAGLGPYTLPITPACSSGGSYELLLAARTSGAQIAWAHGTYATSETSPAMPAWSTALTPYAVDLTHVPADVTSVNFYYELQLTSPGRFGLVDGSRTPTGDTVSVPVSLPTGLAGEVAAGYFARRGNGSRIVIHRLRASGEPPSTMALNEPALPEVADLTLGWPSASRARLSWTQSGTPAEGIVLRLGGEHAGTWVEWEAIVPAGASMFDFPALPAALADLGLVETDTSLEAAIGLVDLPGTVSAPGFRATALRWVHGWIFGYEERDPFELRVVELQLGS
ncbi:MAG: hypothetical protein SFX73_07270 [Kofleriaceae bacterium]|nr:hypothetical protein [Kofleriaceae bacterium]